MHVSYFNSEVLSGINLHTWKRRYFRDASISCPYNLTFKNGYSDLNIDGLRVFSESITLRKFSRQVLERVLLGTEENTMHLVCLFGQFVFKRNFTAELLEKHQFHNFFLQRMHFFLLHICCYVICDLFTDLKSNCLHWSA